MSQKVQIKIRPVDMNVVIDRVRPVIDPMMQERVSVIVIADALAYLTGMACAFGGVQIDPDQPVRGQLDPIAAGYESMTGAMVKTGQCGRVS